MARRKRVTISIDRSFQKVTDKSWLKRVVLAVLGHEVPETEAEVSLVVTSDQKVRQLNRYYRSVDETTDVLSFPFCTLQSDRDSVEFVSPPDGILHLGEVILSYQMAIRQAKQVNISVDYEIAVLVVHGLLHLLGYDHKGRQETSKMKAKEKTILDSLTNK